MELDTCALWLDSYWVRLLLNCGNRNVSVNVHHLILGSNGTNHGVEIHADVVEYATERLHQFIKTNPAIDEYEFCMPQFTQGNCLSLASNSRRYHRVYCGAACPETYELYMKHLLEIGGILVMPMNDQLLQVRRLAENSWTAVSMLPVEAQCPSITWPTAR